MITIRGQELVLRPLDLSDIGQVFDSVLALSTLRTTEEMTSPEALTHVLRIIGVAVRRQMLEATSDEIREAVRPDNIREVLLSLIGQSPNLQLNETDEASSTRH
ncbi:hypothetical protein [Rhodanobacter sp. L36]|uniref:hypothetical protein n=1 Tax=Rhodanobacter sp. L36 TaxID=1747221 RepID=UPI00131D4D68|nr:hypothetical protein [Rhodanobacter sp. L36]